MRRLLQRRRSGAAVPLAMVAVMILLAVGVGLLSLGMNARIYSTRTCDDISARSAADAGLTLAVFDMGQKLNVKPWNGDSLPEATDTTLPYCESVYNYEVTNNGDGTYDVVANGTCGHAARQVGCTLRLQSPFEYAFFAVNGAELKNSAVVDWYNYDDDDPPLKVGTSSTASGAITVGNSASINGDVSVGVGGDVDVAVSNSGTITGSVSAATEAQVLPAITVPEWLQLLPSGGTIENDTTITNSAKYDSIDLKKGKTLQIDGDVTLYITDGVVLGNSAEIEIAEDASLTLYLGGNLEGNNSSNINNLTEDAKKLYIYGLAGCEAIDLKNSSDFYGAVYAPSADVVLYNSANVYGAVVAKSVEMKNSSTLHFDASLRDASVNDEATQFVITDWHEQ